MGGYSTILPYYGRPMVEYSLEEGRVTFLGFTSPPEVFKISGYDMDVDTAVGNKFVRCTFKFDEVILRPGGKRAPLLVCVIPSTPFYAPSLRTTVTLLDAHIRAVVHSPDTFGVGHILRNQPGTTDGYTVSVYPRGAASDHKIEKSVAGTVTNLATEAVDLSTPLVLIGSISGSTIKSSRSGGATWELSVTDTSITSAGYFGFWAQTDGGQEVRPPMSIGAPLSPSPRPIAYFEVPIVGSGTEEDPFRAQLPEDMRNGVNVLAVTHSALIKTGKDGKPIEYRAIVRIFESPSLAPIERVLDALRAMKGVRELAREQAVKEAKRLDDKLSDLDLLGSRELRLDRRQATKEYMSWRIHNLGVREELLDISIQERYVEEDKGW